MRGIRSLLVHLGLVLLSGVALFLVARGEGPGSRSGEVKVVEWDPDTVRWVKYQDPKLTLDLLHEASGAWRIVLADTRNSPSPRFSKYRASQSFQSVLANLLPLKAQRTLSMDPVLLDKVGLLTPGATIEFSDGRGTVRLGVGSELFGGRTTYLRRLPDGPVYVVPSYLLRALSLAHPQYMERALTSLNWKRLVRVDIESGDNAHLGMTRSNPQAPWQNSQKPDQPTSLFENWLDRLSQVQIMDYLIEPTGPPGLKLAHISLEDDQGRRDTIEWSQTREEDSQQVYHLARSASTVNWTVLQPTLVSELARDLPSLLR